MNKFYIIFPAAALVAFIIYYMGFHKDFLAREQQHKDEIEAKAVADKKAKDEAERIATKEAADRQEAKNAAEQAEKDAKAKKQKEEDDKLKAETDAAEKEGNDLSTQLGLLQAKFAEMRRSRGKLQDQAFDLAHEIESMKIERRSAENEIQRGTQMLADRIGQSSLANTDLFPIPTPPPPAKPAAN